MVSSVFGAVAIVEAVEGAHGKSVWFWAFFAMTALFAATFLRLLSTARERDALYAEIADPQSEEAVARRLDGFAQEGDRLLVDMPAADSTAAEWQEAIRSAGWEGVLKHWAFQIESELRRNAPQFMDRWDTNPPGLPEGTGWASAGNARLMVGWAVNNLRDWARTLRGER